MDREDLSMDNILDQDEIENLFMETDEPSNEGNTQAQEGNKEKKEKQTEEINEVSVNVEDLFSGDSEDVGSKEKGEEDTDLTQETSTSPKLYSSLAKACAEEGIFPDLDDESINKISSAEDFRDLIEQQIKAGLDERQKRIDDALNAGIEPETVKVYENTLNQLDDIKVEDLTAETQEAESLRKKIIYQDYINKGFSKDRAAKAVQRSIDSGNDVEDAKEALTSNKEFFQSKYNELVQKAKQEEQDYLKNLKLQNEQLKKSIIDNDKVFGTLTIDKLTRQKAFDSVTKPIYKDPDTGELLTAIGKYQHDNPNDYMKNIGILFTLTDGFKSLDKLVKNQVRKEVKKGFKDLENTLNNTARTSDGMLNFAAGVDDQESVFRGYKLDF